jgi:thiol-disulfide isomerase/thioredoxin
MTLDGMVQDFPKHKSKKYVDMTVAAVDSTFAKTLTERYHDAFAEEMMVENEVLLMSPDGMKTSLSKVLNSLKGKVVYVDFWASWCRPCSAEMEPAAELRERMKGKDIEFIYLSTDEDHSKMCASLDKLKLTGCKVYRILNPKAAKFMYEYNIQLIPRYMIIDHTGNIINDNAPRPSSEEIYTDLHID